MSLPVGKTHVALPVGVVMENLPITLLQSGAVKSVDMGEENSREVRESPSIDEAECETKADNTWRPLPAIVVLLA